MTSAQAQERFDEQNDRQEIEPEREDRPTTPANGAPVGGTADLIRPAAPATERDEAGAKAADDAAPLLPPDSEDRFRTTWEQVQVGFVDQPRESVQRADELVAELMQELAQGFAQARSTLEAEWARGEDVSTEDLRLALQRYRSFFERLLAA